MKRIISGIMIIFAVTLLTGCFNNNFEQNQIVSPEPVNMEVHGTWQVIDKIVVDENLSEKSKNINDYDTITISKEYVSFGETSVENPKFKLKRVRKSTLFTGNLEKAEDYCGDELNEFVDIIDIYDNNNVYFNFIKNEGITNSEGNYFIYNTGTLMEVKKVESSSPEAVAYDISTKMASPMTIEEAGGDIISIDNGYYSMDAGVLVGLKTPGNVNSQGVITDASYRTLWISLINGSIQPIKELDDLLLVPRLNGFSKIELESTEHYWGEEENLIVTSVKKGEKASENILREKNVCKEINFIGSDYIGLGYYNAKEFEIGYDYFKIIPIDSINNSESIDLISIFGESIKDSYLMAKKKAEELNKVSNNSSEVYVEDYRNVNLVRKNGQWSIEARARSEENRKNFIDFSLNISPINTLVNYDSIILPWNKLKEFDSDIRDSVSSPNARMIIILADDELSVYESVSGKIGNKLTSIPIDSNEKIIMSEWATGDFVTYWDTTVDEYNGEIIK